MKFYLYLILGFTMIVGNEANASETSRPLKNLMVTPETSLPANIVPVLPSKPIPSQIILKKIDSKQALKPLAELREFEDLSDFFKLRDPKSIKNACKIMSLNASRIPPLGFYYLANALAREGDMSSAAFYFYTGELRNSFDEKRFPPYQYQSPTLDTSKTKSDDQKIILPKNSNKIIDPQGSYRDIIRSLGAPIRAWVVKHPAEFRDVLARVKLWDEATEYAYRPPYDLTSSKPETEWPQLLTATRADFFTLHEGYINELETSQPPPTLRPFGR
jgi:hypothetical protein